MIKGNYILYAGVALLVATVIANYFGVITQVVYIIGLIVAACVLILAAILIRREKTK